jgi:hypothetical protein
MRELKDRDLLKWNERMDKSTYRVRVNSNWVNNHQLVSFYLREISDSPHPIYNVSQPIKDCRDCPDPVVKWEFSFSVVESRKNEFLKILERLLLKGVANHVDLYGDGSKHEKINISEDILTSSDETKHEVYNRSYVKYTYKFNGRLSSIMSYITIIEDAIEFFSNIWRYDEKGEEHCLIKYPIGTVVSKVKDKSNDFLVLDYDYVVDYKKYIINYVISKMYIDKKYMTIKYADPEKVSEDDLCYSRNNRIDNILN